MLKRRIWTGAIANFILLAVVLCAVLATKVQHPLVVNDTNKGSSVAPWTTKPTTNFPSSTANNNNKIFYWNKKSLPIKGFGRLNTTLLCQWLKPLIEFKLIRNVSANFF